MRTKSDIHQFIESLMMMGFVSTYFLLAVFQKELDQVGFFFKYGWLLLLAAVVGWSTFGLGVFYIKRVVTRRKNGIR